MIIDTSVLVAILRNEPERQDFLERMVAADELGVSAASLLEAGIVIDSLRSPEQSKRLDTLLLELDARVHPVTEQQARIAREAYRDFGRGSGHRARLNFGDCFAYALAKDLDAPLLFKGDDFVHTDVRRAR